MSEELWQAVQDKLAASAPGHPDAPRAAVAEVFLRGMLFDHADRPMRGLHTTKGSKRYRYYAAAAGVRNTDPGGLPRIAMGVLDAFVIERAEPLLSATWRAGEVLTERVRAALVRVELGQERISIEVRRDASVARPHIDGADVDVMEDRVRLGFSVRLKHRQGALLITAPSDSDPLGFLDRALVRAVCLARSWADQLAKGHVGTLKELAQTQGFCDHYAARLLPLAWLAPDLVQQILDGRQPRGISLAALTQIPLPTLWAEQRALFRGAMKQVQPGRF